MDRDPLMLVCRATDGSDVVPLLVVAAVFLAVYLIWRRFAKGRRPMKKVLIVVALAAAVAAAVAIKQGKRAEETGGAPAAAATNRQLPRLVDLGADKCIPCKMMAPILEELRTNYAGRLDVEFIDVWKNEGAGEKHGIRVIPTQIFISADGKELFRHEGFFSKEDILAKWKQCGVNLD